MESTNLTPPNDDQLDARLRETPAPLADNGFSLRVLAALPARAKPAEHRRLLLCLAGLAAGFAVALPNLDRWPNLAVLSGQLTRTLVELAANQSACAGLGLAILALVLTLRSGKNQKSWL